MHSFLYNMIQYGIIEFQGSSSFTMFYSFTVFRCCMASPVWTYPQWPFLKVGIMTVTIGFFMGGTRRYKILRPKSNLVIGCLPGIASRGTCRSFDDKDLDPQSGSNTITFPGRLSCAKGPGRVGRKTPVSRSIFGPFWSHVRRARLVSYSTKPGKLLITSLMVQICSNHLGTTEPKKLNIWDNMG